MSSMSTPSKKSNSVSLILLNTLPDTDSLDELVVRSMWRHSKMILRLVFIVALESEVPYHLTLMLTHLHIRHYVRISIQTFKHSERNARPQNPISLNVTLLIRNTVMRSNCYTNGKHSKSTNKIEHVVVEKVIVFQAINVWMTSLKINPLTLFLELLTNKPIERINHKVIEIMITLIEF